MVVEVVVVVVVVVVIIVVVVLVVVVVVVVVVVLVVVVVVVPGRVTMLKDDCIPIPDPTFPDVIGFGLILEEEGRLVCVITLVNRSLNSFNAARL